MLDFKNSAKKEEKKSNILLTVHHHRKRTKNDKHAKSKSLKPTKEEF